MFSKCVSTADVDRVLVFSTPTEPWTSVSTVKVMLTRSPNAESNFGTLMVVLQLVRRSGVLLVWHCRSVGWPAKTDSTNRIAAPSAPTRRPAFAR